MNEKEIKNLQWNTKDRVIKVSSGLSIRVRKSSKTYIIRKKVNGKAQVITLGKSPELSLKDAKIKAGKYLLADSVNNIVVKEVVEKYFEEIIKDKSKVVNQVRGYFNQINTEIGRVKLITLNTASLVKFIQKYSKEHGARSSDRLRSYLIQIFGYAAEIGYISESPMTNVSTRVTGYQASERKRIVKEKEIKMIWSWKNPIKGWQKTEDNAKVIKFLLLTGLRISEANSGYIDGTKFRIDDSKGKHSKGEKRPHWVFLTKSAASLLPLPKCSATNIQAWLRRKLIREGYVIDRFTPHDCRRTFATLANDNDVDSFIVERVLNHKLPGIMSVYNHAEYEKERIYAAKVVEKIILKILNQRE